MSNSAMIRDSIKLLYRRGLHTDREEAGEDPFRTNSQVIEFFEGLGAIVYGFSNASSTSTRR